MCRSPDYHIHGYSNSGLYQKKTTHDLLKIKAFYLHLSIHPSSASNSKSDLDLPDFVTLLFLPRRINDSPLEVNGSMIRPDSAAFLTLHRLLLLNEPPCRDVFVFSTREPVRTSHGSRFEVLLGQHSLLKGVFRRGDDEEISWRIECKCLLEREFVGVHIKQAEISIAVQGGNKVVMMSEKVDVVAASSSRRRRRCPALEEIPEEEEREHDDVQVLDDDEFGSDVDGEFGGGGGCCCSDELIELEMEGVKWVLDVGIWVICLGLGFMLSRASATKLRRRKLT